PIHSGQASQVPPRSRQLFAALSRARSTSLAGQVESRVSCCTSSFSRPQCRRQQPSSHFSGGTQLSSEKMASFRWGQVSRYSSRWDSGPVNMKHWCSRFSSSEQLPFTVPGTELGVQVLQSGSQRGSHSSSPSTSISATSRVF